nr:type IIL restriction-modification enzyme MmeI [Bifidobacterium longum]
MSGEITKKQEESWPSPDSARKIDTPVVETTEFLRTGLACTRTLGQSTVEAGQLVLASRSNHPTSSLKTLYDPKYMPVDLRQAHEHLDKIVDVAFGAGKWLKDDDSARLKVLFDSYRKLA